MGVGCLSGNEIKFESVERATTPEYRSLTILCRALAHGDKLVSVEIESRHYEFAWVLNCLTRQAGRFWRFAAFHGFSQTRADWSAAGSTLPL
jgi:hypothetical protein